MRQVAQHSMNVPTVKIAQKIGIEKVLYYAEEMGITTLVKDGPHNDNNLSSALGGLTKGVTPLELTSAYGTFANKGVHVDPVVIVKVLDRNGKVIDEANPEQHNVISESSAAELTSMLQDVISAGTGRRANIGRPAAGKTGTTSDYHDVPARRARRVTTTTRGSSATRRTSSRASGSATTTTPRLAASTAAPCRPPSGRTS